MFRLDELTPERGITKSHNGLWNGQASSSWVETHTSENNEGVLFEDNFKLIKEQREMLSFI